MSVTLPPMKSANGLLTYEAYLAETPENRHYEIIEGVRHEMPGNTDRHQDMQGNVYTLLRQFEQKFRLGKVRIAPRDVLIRRSPLRTRQPDVFFISNERRAFNPSLDDPAPMTEAPELVVEIISDSETETRFNDKVTDYQTVGVRECWKVMNETQTVEVLTLTETSRTSVATYGIGETIQSVVFPALTVSVESIFEEE